MAYAKIKLNSGRELHFGFEERIGLFNFWLYEKHLTGKEACPKASTEGVDCNTPTEFFTNLGLALRPEELAELGAIGFVFRPSTRS